MNRIYLRVTAEEFKELSLHFRSTVRYVTSIKDDKRYEGIHLTDDIIALKEDDE